MHTKVISAAVLLLGLGFAHAGGMRALIREPVIVDGSLVHQTATPPVRPDKDKEKKKPPVKVAPPSNAGGSSSRNVGQGQPCLCTTNYKGETTCTGECR